MYEKIKCPALHAPHGPRSEWCEAPRPTWSREAFQTAAAIGPFLDGEIIVVLGYEVTFIVCLVVQIIALVILMNWIPEPRTLLAARASAIAPESD